MASKVGYRAWVWVTVFVFCVGCGSESADPGIAEDVYEQRDTSTDGGTGRIYMNREIADVMKSEHGAIWLERPTRDTEELPSRLLQVLELNQANVVADIGAGTGFLTFRLARLVPSGRVLAIEVQQAMLDTIRTRMQRDNVRNIQLVLGSPENPALPPSSVDLALIVSSYHEFSHPREMLTNIYAGLKEGGRLVIVEYRGEDETIAAPRVHRMTEDQIRTELDASGFRWRDTFDVLPQQHIVVFEKPVLTQEGS